MLDTIRRMVPATVRRSYALKFGIALLVLGLSVGAIGIVATAQITDSVEGNALEEQQSIAAQEATAIDNWDDQNVRRTASTSDTPVVESGDDDAIQSYLYDLQIELSGQVEAIHYVDQTDHELLATTTAGATTLEDVSFPEPERIDGDLSASTVERTEPYAVDDTPVVAYYISTGGQDETAIVMSFELEHVMTDLGAAVEGERSTVVVDREGRIVLDDRLTGSGADGLQDAFVDTGFLEPYGDDHALLEEALASENATHAGATTFDDRPVEALQSPPHDFDPDGYVAAYHGTETGWVVLSHTSTDEAYGFVNAVNQYGTMATLAGVLLIGLVGAVIGRNTATSIDRLTRKVGQMEDGDLDVEFETTRVDNIGRLYDGFASMRDELKQQITEAEDARAEAERERERVQQLNDELERAAASYGDVMETAADGDLTVRMDPDATDDETMQTIAADFNEMLTEIEATVEHINRFATDVATASEQVTASSEEVRSASRQVSESVQEISDGANEQYESLRSVDAEMNNLSTTTEEIAASSNEVADIAERTAKTGREGREALAEAIEACDELESEGDAVVEEFERLREEVGQIDDLTERIAEIAEQTNMLALNANIEASRSSAGDDDGGFAAVAAEVKELSQDVKTATEEIGARLERIQDQTERSAEEVERTSDEIEAVSELVTDAGDALDEIAEYAASTNDGVQSISAATEEQAASTQEVVAMVDEVATIAEETTAEAETVAASAEEQTSALTEVSTSANDLSKRAVALSEALDRFETDADAATAVDSLEAIDGVAGHGGEGADGDADGDRDGDDTARTGNGDTSRGIEGGSVDGRDGSATVDGGDGGDGDSDGDGNGDGETFVFGEEPATNPDRPDADSA